MQSCGLWCTCVCCCYAYVSHVYATLRAQDQGYTWCRFIFEEPVTHSTSRGTRLFSRRLACNLGIFIQFSVYHIIKPCIVLLLYALNNIADILFRIKWQSMKFSTCYYLYSEKNYFFFQTCVSLLEIYTDATSNYRGEKKGLEIFSFLTYRPFIFHPFKTSFRPIVDIIANILDLWSVPSSS